MQAAHIQVVIMGSHSLWQAIPHGGGGKTGKEKTIRKPFMSPVMIYFVHQGVLHWFEFALPGLYVLLGNCSFEAKPRNSKHCLIGIAVGNECVVKRKKK